MLTPAKLAVLCAARDRVCAAGTDAPTIHEVAAKAGLSTGSFIRQFSAVFGDTPHQMRMRARVERAKQMLAEGELSVTEVCFELGFSSLGSFSEMFRRRVGMSPSDYRIRYRGHDLRPGCFSLMAAAATTSEAGAISEKQQRPVRGNPEP